MLGVVVAMATLAVCANTPPSITNVSTHKYESSHEEKGKFVLQMQESPGKIQSEGSVRQGQEFYDRTDQKNPAVQSAQDAFFTWLAAHPYNKAAHKIDLKKLCGREFGEGSGWMSKNKISTGGTGVDILVPFPPFKRMHCLYGAQPDHPMVWCHFGRYPKVEPNDLTIQGDYAHEAKLLKERFEQLFGISMISLSKGDGYIYKDDYNVLTITLDERRNKGNQTEHYPLVVDIVDKELDRQSSYISDVYGSLRHIERCKQLLANPKQIRNPNRGDKGDEFVSVLPMKSYGIFTIGKLPDLDRDVVWVKKSFNAEYLEVIDGVPFRVWIGRKGDAISSITVESLESFKSKEDAFLFYDKFRHELKRSGVQMQEGENYCRWQSPTDINVEMSLNLRLTSFGLWQVSLFLKDLGNSSKK